MRASATADAMGVRWSFMGSFSNVDPGVGAAREIDKTFLQKPYQSVLRTSKLVGTAPQ
jgi:hypothetical protein